MPEAMFVLMSVGLLLVRAGMVVRDCGMSRSKNAASSLVRGVLDIGVAALAFWLVGAAIQRGDITLVAGWEDAEPAQTFHQICLAILCCGIIATTVSERSRPLPLIILSALVAGVMLPLLAMFSRDGFLARLGLIDLGGAGYVHLLGATVACCAAISIGPRPNKFNRDGSANAIPAHSVPLLYTGILLAVVGWTPYLLSSTYSASLAETLQTVPVDLPGKLAINVIVAVAGAAIATALFSVWRYGKVDALLLLTGMGGALVAMTPAAGLIPSVGAFAVGVLAGFIIPIAVLMIDVFFNIDDMTSAIAIHGVGGVLGLVASAWMIDGDFLTRFQRFGAAMIAIVLAVVIGSIVSLGVMYAVSRFQAITSSEEEEYDGLDLAEHDINAYPDFHQNMIKSYHLRQT